MSFGNIDFHIGNDYNSDIIVEEIKYERFI